MKELWVFGSLRELGDGEEEGSMAEDAKVSGELLEALLDQHRMRHGSQSNVMHSSEKPNPQQDDHVQDDVKMDE